MILLVEDDPKDVTLAEFALKRILPGIQINVVSDGLTAVSYLAGDGPYTDRSKYPMPDVVLLDLQLPLLHGFEVVRWIRKQEKLKSLPVIALTGSKREEDTRMAVDAGATTCMLKSQGFRLLAEKVVEIAAPSQPIPKAEILAPQVAETAVPFQPENTSPCSRSDAA